MNGFFTAKNLATLGGVVLSFIIPHLIFTDEQYEIEYIEPDTDDQDEDVTNTETPEEEK